jgi:hypothetical protein
MDYDLGRMDGDRPAEPGRSRGLRPLMLRSIEDIQREIHVTTHAIRIALWLSGGADVELAKTLISKRMGLARSTVPVQRAIQTSGAGSQPSEKPLPRVKP